MSGAGALKVVKILEGFSHLKWSRLQLCKTLQTAILHASDSFGDHACSNWLNSGGWFCCQVGGAFGKAGSTRILQVGLLASRAGVDLLDTFICQDLSVLTLRFVDKILYYCWDGNLFRLE